MGQGRAHGVPGAALTLLESVDPSVVLGLLAAAAGFVYYRRRAAQPDGARPALFWLGLAAFAVALIGPLDTISDHYLVSAHMLQHILLTMVGPPLLLAGLPTAGGRYMPAFLVNPWLAVTVFNLTLLAWHVPALYDATLREAALHIVEHLTFIGTAMLFWWPVVGPGRLGAAMSPLMKIGYLAFAGVPPTVLGMSLAIAGPLYSFYLDAPRIVAGLSPALDQQIAGILMFGLGNLIYFVPISVLFFRIGDEPEPAVA